MKPFRIVVIIQDEFFKVSSGGTKEGTTFSGGNERMIRRARNTASMGLKIPLGMNRNTPRVRAGYDSPLALTASLYAIAPQYAHVYDAPDEVFDAVNGFCIGNHTS